MNVWGYPHLGFGVGLRSAHYDHILREKPAVDWFEVISENYMAKGGRPIYVLERVAERYPVVLHGVSLSIGSVDPLNFDYLRSLKRLADRIKPRWISDHLCWTGISGKNLHQLLPMPFTTDTLRHTLERVKIVQDFLEAPIALENASTYLEFAFSDLSESEFLSTLAREAPCAILLDVNNVYINSQNHGFDANAFIDSMPERHVIQLHLAGHRKHSTHIVDTHDCPVSDPVWTLYCQAYKRFGGVSTLVEWDGSIPAFDIVHAEALKAKRLIAELGV